MFHYYTAGFGLLREATHRGVHMAFVLGLIFLVFGVRRQRVKEPRPSSLFAPLGIPILDWLMAIGAAVGSLYVPWIYDDLAFRVGNPLLIDWVMGTILIVVLLEATRRAVGPPLLIISVVLMAYAMAGPYLPGVLAHPGNTWKGVVNHLYLTSQGIYGIPLGVVATYVFHYVLFGVLATRIGLGRMFIDLAMALAGRLSGGPAKVSIFASGLFGMISGSSIANTVTVGSLTIPMMVRIGYPRHFAGAVESTAATGGQITPPIMGAAAFLMIEYLNLPYTTIILAAIVPAFMHFFGVLCQVHFEAHKLGMRGVPAADLPKVVPVIAEGWPTAVPLVILLSVLFSGYTPYLAAFWGITACMVVGLTGRNPIVALVLMIAAVGAVLTGLITEWVALGPLLAGSAAVSLWSVFRAGNDGWTRVIDILDSFVLGAKYAIGVGAAAATVGIIVGVVTLTGVGFKLSDIITSSAGNFAAFLTAGAALSWADPAALTLLFTLIMTAIVCLLLGCGVPTTANYIIMVTIAQPALAKLGIAPIVSHFFVFYYGVLADITPPVALAAYAGASMAGADPFKTGNTAFRLGLAKALVPFVFVYQPAMLIVTKEFTWPLFIETAGTCAIGIVMLAAALTGFGLAPLRGFSRFALAVASLLMIAPSRIAMVVGLLIAAPIVIMQLRASRAGQAVAP
jgi:TRAP transporter 4TM/12TM fusion protein